MNVKIDHVTHRAFALLYPANYGTCCYPDDPCSYHMQKLTWRLQTFCQQTITVKGRPKVKKVTCLMCLASL